MANGNGTGKGGKNFQDRVLAAEVRTLTLEEIKKVLKNKKPTEFKKQLLLRLAGSVLPRLSEVTGEGGGPVAVTLVKYGGGTATT